MLWLSSHFTEGETEFRDAKSPDKGRTGLGLSVQQRDSGEHAPDHCTIRPSATRLWQSRVRARQHAGMSLQSSSFWCPRPKFGETLLLLRQGWRRNCEYSVRSQQRGARLIEGQTMGHTICACGTHRRPLTCLFKVPDSWQGWSCLPCACLLSPPQPFPYNVP